MITASILDFPHVGARTGAQMLERLAQNQPTLWYKGQLVQDLANFPPLKNGIATLSGLYDYQWAHK